MRRQVWLVLAGAMILLAVTVVGFGLRAAHHGGHDVATAAADGDSGVGGDEAGDPDAGPQLAKARVAAALQSPLQAAPVQGAPTAGWAGASLFNATGNDWEPAVATSPNSAYTYVLTTRYGGTPACKSACPNPALILKVSSDYGKTWGAESYLCACKSVKAQNDPEMVVLPSGTVYAAWMNDWKIVFSKSTDHGKTWSAPVTVVGNLSWSDKPIIAASANGNDVYIAFNKSDAYVAVSHNAGSTWKQVVSQANGRYHFANSGTVLPNGTIAFGEVSYAQDSTGPDVIQVHRSTDNGATWSVVDVDTVQEMSHCVTGGCSIDYWGPNAALAADASGNLVLGYNGNTTALAPQRMWARTSTNGGATWTARVDVTGLTGSGSGTAGAAYPAATGTSTGDFRIYFMDDRNGTAAWNVWFVQSTNGGSTWSAPVRISDATSGPSYVTASGFAQPYGDYGQIAARADGGTIAVWGAGVSYTGPGGTWINRTTP